MDYGAIAAAIAAAIFWYRGAEMEKISPIPWTGTSVLLSGLVMFVLHRGWLVVLLAQVGLLVFALFVLAMSGAFSAQLERRLDSAKVAADVRAEIRGQETKLAAIDIPKHLDAAQRATVTKAIDESFVFGFRLVMVLGAGLAVVSAAGAWLMLGKRT